MLQIDAPEDHSPTIVRSAAKREIMQNSPVAKGLEFRADSVGIQREVLGRQGSVLVIELDNKLTGVLGLRFSSRAAFLPNPLFRSALRETSDNDDSFVIKVLGSTQDVANGDDLRRGLTR